MPRDRQKVLALLEETQKLLEESIDTFEEEYPPVPSTEVIRVAVGDNVQDALDQARITGATILLAVGEHRTNLVINEDLDALPVRITSDTDNLPGRGIRITKDYLPGIARLQSANDIDPVIRYNCRSSAVHLVGIGILPQQKDRTMITFGTDNMYSVDEQPHDVLHDRILMLGDPVNGQHRGIQAHVRRYVLSNSTLLDFHEEGRDSQALAAWNGGQFLTLKNTHFNAGTENIMIGGGNARTEVMAPSDIVIEDCKFDKNPNWMSGMEYPPQIKCLLEIKHARRIIIRRNIFEYCWPESWSTGVGIVIKCTDQHGNEPWTLTENVDFENNIVRHVGQGFSIVGANDDGRETQLMRNVRIVNNLIHNINQSPYTGKGSAFYISNMPDNLLIDHNTILGNSWGIIDLTYNQSQKGLGFALINTVVWEGRYGIKSKSGANPDAWEADMGYAPTITSLAVRKDPESGCKFGPGNVEIVAEEFDASIDEDYSIKPGSPIGNVMTTDGEMIGANVYTLP